MSTETAVYASPKPVEISPASPPAGNCKLEVLLENQLQRVVRVPPASRKPSRAVVFVHGFLGDYRTTWTNADSKAFFPSLLALDAELADYDFYVFQYATKSFGPPAIDNVVTQLRFALKEHLAMAGNIIFIAHSLGGLVSMRCVLRLIEELDPPSIGGLLLFGSPMTGVEWAKYARMVLRLGTPRLPLLHWLDAYLSSNKQIDALTAGSEFVELLNSQWVLRVLNGGHPKVPAAQRAWFPVRVVSANDDWVVKESSARGFYSNIDWLNVDCDHRALVKPRDDKSLSYQIARDFLKQCREWLAPQILLRLRQQLDEVWALHSRTPIANWQFELCFGEQQTVTKDGCFGLTGFRSFNVNRCCYERKIISRSLKFGLALGEVAARSMWSDEFVFLHSIRLGGLPESEGNLVRQRVRAALGNRNNAWSQFFDSFTARIRHPQETSWHKMSIGEREFVEDGMVVNLHLPDEALGFLGSECAIEISFRGLMPVQITDYTVRFPWLCYGFTTRVTLNGQPAYFVSTPAMRGNSSVELVREGTTKLEYSSKELILPESFIRFEWGF